MTTLSEMYLGSEPESVSAVDDQLVIALSDGRRLQLPLSFVSQFDSEALPQDAQLLVLSTPPKIDHLHITDNELRVYLADGRTLSAPLAWFPRLLHGSSAERSQYELCGEDDVIHWPALDEDIELTRLFSGGRSRESERSLQRWLAARQQDVRELDAK